MLFNENRIIQSNSTNNNTSQDSSETSNNSLIFILVFGVPAGLALMFFITLLIIRKFKPRVVNNKNKIIQLQNKNSKLKILSKDTFKDHGPSKIIKDKEAIKNNKSTSRISFIFENEMTNVSPENKNSKIAKENKLGLKRTQTKALENIADNNDATRAESPDKKNFSSGFKNFWKSKLEIAEEDVKLKKILKLRKLINTKNQTDNSNSISFSKSIFSRDNPNS